MSHRVRALLLFGAAAFLSSTLHAQVVEVAHAALPPTALVPVELVVPDARLRSATLADISLEGDEQASDSLYRLAREALSRGDYRRAATLFSRVATTYPNTARASDALYYYAFSLYRIGDSDGLRSAIVTLDRLNEKYPRASVRGDARTLRVRVCGELAKRGDEECASEVSDLARSSSSSSSASSASSSSSSSSSSQAQARCPNEDDENDERIAALNALLTMDSENALPILERVLARRDACSVGLRRKAVFLVSQKRDPRAADMLLNAAKSDPDKEVRGQALFWLGQTRDDRAVDMLGDVMKGGDAELQEKAIFGLAQHRSPKAAQFLRDAASDDNAPDNVREQAIFWLGQSRGSEATAFLRGLYGRLRNTELKEKVLFSVSQNRNPENGQWLLSIAENEREQTQLRKNALFWLGQSRALDLNALGGMYQKLQDREMKEQVIFVISQRRETAAVDKLLEIARTERDRELRSKAIFWLSQSKDPRVAKFLEEIISK